MASTEGWQPVFIRVQSIMRSYRLYHPADLWRSHNTMPTSEACSDVMPGPGARSPSKAAERWGLTWRQV